MFEELKKYTVFAGNYGSGKTELSLNAAIAKAGSRTMLLDMDIVNPYVRSSEQEERLRAIGVRVIKPCFANTAVDVPSLPPDIFAPFDSPVDFAIFDAGGDPVGAAALGQLAERFRENSGAVDMFYVINALRPLQENAGEIIEMLRQIEAAAKLRVTGLINNTNLAAQTDAAHVRRGHALVREVSEQTGIPIRYVAAREDIAPELAGLGAPMLPLKIYMRPDWLDEVL